MLGGLALPPHSHIPVGHWAFNSSAFPLLGTVLLAGCDPFRISPSLGCSTTGVAGQEHTASLQLLLWLLLPLSVPCWLLKFPPSAG